MTQIQPLVFSGVSPEQFETLRQKAKTGGIDLDGPTGTASKFGVEVAWNYSAETRELSLHCLKAPFFMSVQDVQAKMETMVKESLA